MQYSEYKPGCKFLVVTGGVLSGLGKGVAAASIGNLITNAGLKVVPVKCDGYLNVDPGTLNPVEHGEVFVLDDGAEVDMDFGHYERFLGIRCKKSWSITMGKVYEEVRIKERRGDYLGKTVQLIPHVTDLIKEKFFSIAREESADLLIIEVGGTIGDIENELFVEACRQLKREISERSIMFVHLTYVPIPHSVHEQKSKPTQQSVSLLREKGIEPDVIIGRCIERLDQAVKHKISVFCNIDESAVISGVDLDSVYKMPIVFSEEGINSIIREKLGINSGVGQSWQGLVNNIDDPKNDLVIAICGKYTKLEDSYASVVEALRHCSAYLRARVKVRLIDSSKILSQEDASKLLFGVDGVIVPGGFGSRGVEGKIQVIQYCRENLVPFLGICYGMQLAVVEFARNVCGLAGANSTEVDPGTPNPVIDYLPGQSTVTDKGATMRLGSYPARLLEGSKVRQLYEDKELVFERHRHRFEVNADFHEQLLSKGLVFSGVSPDARLVEFIELASHPYFVGTQSHPELKSRFTSPAPLFLRLATACLEKRMGSANAEVAEVFSGDS